MKLPLYFPPFKHVMYEYDTLTGWYTLAQAKRPKRPVNMLPECIRGARSEAYTLTYGTERVIVGRVCAKNGRRFIAPVLEAEFPRWHIGSAEAQKTDEKNWRYTILFYQHDLSGMLHAFFFNEPDLKTDKQRMCWANSIIPQLRLSFNAKELSI